MLVVILSAVQRAQWHVQRQCAKAVRNGTCNDVCNGTCNGLQWAVQWRVQWHVQWIAVRCAIDCNCNCSALCNGLQLQCAVQRRVQWIALQWIAVQWIGIAIAVRCAMARAPCAVRRAVDCNGTCNGTCAVHCSGLLWAVQCTCNGTCNGLQFAVRRAINFGRLSLGPRTESEGRVPPSTRVVVACPDTTSRPPGFPARAPKSARCYCEYR